MPIDDATKHYYHEVYQALFKTDKPLILTHDDQFEPIAEAVILYFYARPKGERLHKTGYRKQLDHVRYSLTQEMKGFHFMNGNIEPVWLIYWGEIYGRQLEPYFYEEELPEGKELSEHGQ
ncbi:MAG TPA: hypothetical protein DCR93_30600 [Cytophagales bacterium]|nr:hypothetical protein [Cytophagales bacterium]